MTHAQTHANLFKMANKITEILIAAYRRAVYPFYSTAYPSSYPFLSAPLQIQTPDLHFKPVIKMQRIKLTIKLSHWLNFLCYRWG